jgi:glycosyltransferase involved in cell wall biosynthesis
MIAGASKIVSVSEFSFAEALSRYDAYKSKFVVIPNAVDTDRFAMPKAATRQGVVTVGLVSGVTIRRKSLQVFAGAARRMPDVNFTLIGKVVDREGQEFVDSLPPNVFAAGRLSDEALVSRLQASSVYFQASVHEAFCVAMAEAMSCGCFPVISNYAALPEVAGPTATVLKALTPESAEIAIRTALSKPDSERETARRRIVEHYGIESRRELLCSTIQTVIDQSKR